MKYIKLTEYHCKKPLWIRSDQVASWYFDRGHYHIVPLYDEVDIEVKEDGEEIYNLLKDQQVRDATKDDLPHRKPFYPRNKRRVAPSDNKWAAS